MSWQGVEKRFGCSQPGSFFVDPEVHAMKRCRIPICHSETLAGEVRSFLGLEKHARARAKIFAPLLQ
jgi:hypothetical protein